MRAGMKPCFMPFWQWKAAMFCLDWKYLPALPVQEYARTAEFCWSLKMPLRLMVLQALVYLTETIYRPLFSAFLRFPWLQNCINCSSTKSNLRVCWPLFQHRYKFLFPARSEWLHQFPKHELYSFCRVDSPHPWTSEESSPCPLMAVNSAFLRPGGALWPTTSAEVPQVPAAFLCSIYRIDTRVCAILLPAALG